MKNTDLRVGNLVSLSGSLTLTVYEIHEDCFYAKDAKGSSFKNTWADLKPINLTEEILLRCGFDINEGKTLFEHSKCGLKLMDIVGLYYRANFPIKADVTSVHQLQNLYQALTGQELKIEL